MSGILHGSHSVSLMHLHALIHAASDSLEVTYKRAAVKH